MPNQSQVIPMTRTSTSSLWGTFFARGRHRKRKLGIKEPVGGVSGGGGGGGGGVGGGEGGGGVGNDLNILPPEVKGLFSVN